MVESRAMWKWRWLAKAEAKAGGYFWMPCPVCGEDFAGFECGQWGVPVDYGRGWAACAKPSCQLEAKRRTQDFHAAYDEGVTFDGDIVPEPCRY